MLCCFFLLHIGYEDYTLYIISITLSDDAKTVIFEVSFVALSFQLLFFVIWSVISSFK